jgi:hypothetical protein
MMLENEAEHETERKQRKQSVTQEGFRVLSEWLRASNTAEAQRARMDAAYRDLEEAQEALVAWMLPPAIKAQPGERICIWFGDSLIQVEVGGVCSNVGGNSHRTSTKVTVRYQGREFHKLM